MRAHKVIFSEQSVCTRRIYAWFREMLLKRRFSIFALPFWPRRDSLLPRTTPPRWPRQYSRLLGRRPKPDRRSGSPILHTAARLVVSKTNTDRIHTKSNNNSLAFVGHHRLRGCKEHYTIQPREQTKVCAVYNWGTARRVHSNALVSVVGCSRSSHLGLLHFSKVIAMLLYYAELKNYS